MSPAPDPRPLVAHVVYRFDVGGLENGVVNLINHMPKDCYRHAVIALTEVADFKDRIARNDVQYFDLHKPPGHTIRVYPALFSLFRKLRPAIVHTRNLAALEATVPAWLAGVRVRIHGEHGRDIYDLDGSSARYRWIRRLYRPFVTHYIALSSDLLRYLTKRVNVAESCVTHIYNGVDARRFEPSTEPSPIKDWPFPRKQCWVVGSVGRVAGVKDHLTLARAFVRVLRADPALRQRLRLVIIGDGPLLAPLRSFIEQADVADLCWLPGERMDVPQLLTAFDCFVLPSLAEGVSNTILEAMACALPVIATDVGGNPELVDARQTGALVPAEDPEALAQQILVYARAPEAARMAGRAGRARVERLFSLEAMVSRYTELYDRQLASVSLQTPRANAL